MSSSNKAMENLAVKFLRLAQRLGQTDNLLQTHVLLKLGLPETTQARFRAFSRAAAEHLELQPGHQEPLGLACTILLIGKSGAGKTATLNSIFDKPVSATDPFGPGTSKIQAHTGTLHGVNVRVIDTPGLSLSDRSHNEKTLRSVKRFLIKTTPDIVLYVDRLDKPFGEFRADEALVGAITSVFGPTLLSKFVVVLTHATSLDPWDVPQRTRNAQASISRAFGVVDNPIPVSLVENHSGCPTNTDGQRVLPNGLVWKHDLLLWCFAYVVLEEANTLRKAAGPPAPRRIFLLPHLPSLISSLIHTRPQVKLPSEQFGDDDDDDNPDSEDEYEYDKLPPFKPLTKGEVEKLSRSQRKAYYDEIDYREKLFMQKQVKVQKRQRKLMREMREKEKTQEEEETNDQIDEGDPDPTLPVTFDSDDPAHRYRSLNRRSPWTVQPDCDDTGIVSGVNVERLFVLKKKIPVSVRGQFSTGKIDKNNLAMEIASSIKHGKGKSTTLGFDIQPFGYDGDKAYTVRGETLFSNRGMNKASAGAMATLSGGVLSGGVKLVDKVSIGRWVELEGCGGAVCGAGDVAKSVGLKVRVVDRDDPWARFVTGIGLTAMEWRGDVAIGGSADVRAPVGRNDNLVARINVDNRGRGKVCVNFGGSDRVQVALVFLIPLVRKMLLLGDSAWGDKLARLFSGFF